MGDQTLQATLAERITLLLRSKDADEKYNKLLELLSPMSTRIDCKVLGSDNDYVHWYVRSLHRTTENGKWQRIIDALLDNRYDINNQDHLGCTPLLSYLNNMRFDLAQLKGKESAGVQPADVVRKLLACGASVNRASHDGNTPLYVSVSIQDIELTTMILEAGGDARSSIGGSVLYALGKVRYTNNAVLSQSLRMIQLLEDRVDFNDTCVDGSSIGNMQLVHVREDSLTF